MNFIDNKRISGFKGQPMTTVQSNIGALLHKKEDAEAEDTLRLYGERTSSEEITVY